MREPTAFFLRTLVVATVFSGAMIVALHAARQSQQPLAVVESNLFGRNHFLEEQAQPLEVPWQVIDRQRKGDSLPFYNKTRPYLGPYFGLGVSRIL